MALMIQKPHPDSLCLVCSTVVRPGEKCHCFNQLAVNGEHKFAARDPRLVALINDDAISISGGRGCIDLSSKYISLLPEPLHLLNGIGERIGIINPSGKEVKDNSAGTISSWDTRFGGPVPIVQFSIGKTSMSVNGVEKNTPLLASDYHGVLLLRSGYTEVFTPDLSAPSVIMLHGRMVGVRRLTKLLS